jgi:hypothetical protein
VTQQTRVRIEAWLDDPAIVFIEDHRNGFGPVISHPREPVRAADEADGALGHSPPIYFQAS